MTSSRKKDHVDLCVDSDVAFRQKTSGLEGFELVHDALPEVNLGEVDCGVEFMGRRCRLPFLVNSMTGGYEEAEEINRGLAAACEETGVSLGLGSQRQALETDRFHSSWRAAREAAPSIPIFGNIGAVEVAKGIDIGDLERLVEMVDADGFAVHLNPLQELMQPEGETTFRGVLEGIERLVKELSVPVLVKEVGAGLSADVVRRLIDVGVRYVDVSGAGGTSWSGVELLRNPDAEPSDEDLFWDWGIPTAEALVGARPLCDEADAVIIASGGIASPRDMAVCFPLGASMVAAARPFLQHLRADGVEGLVREIELWGRYLRYAMFLTGSPDVATFRRSENLRPRLLTAQSG